MNGRYRYIRHAAVVFLAGFGLVSLLSVPVEGITLARWFGLMAVSKMVGVVALMAAVALAKID